jgi:hypothetical protein
MLKYKNRQVAIIVGWMFVAAILFVTVTFAAVERLLPSEADTSKVERPAVHAINHGDSGFESRGPQRPSQPKG